jgi:multidrug efflux system outer membrane protein
VRARPLLLTALLATVPVVAGCRLDPRFKVPDAGTQSTWRDGSRDVESLANVAWFEIYDDEVLRSLIREAIANNPDLGVALARIDEARAIAKATGADLYPRVDLSAAAGAVRSSALEVPFGDRTNGLASVTFDLAWELDVFGRIRSQSSAAKARYFESIEAHRDVGIRLVADVARAYFEMRELDDLFEISVRTLRSRSEYVDLAKIRFEGGKTSELDFRQAESEYFRTEVVYVDTQRQIAAKEHEISVLIGRPPGDVLRGRTANDQNLPPPNVPAGLPSDLLRRRPDIVAAEMDLAAETALVGAARANLYPRIALTGDFGWESDALSDLFTSESLTSSLIAGLLQPIFNAGQNRALVQAQCARMRASMELYRGKVLAAFREVEDGLVDYRRFTESRAVQARRIAAQRKVLELAEIRYEGGVSQYLEVLDAQRELFDAEIEEADTIRSQLVALTFLYKALGGGWDPALHCAARPCVPLRATCPTPVRACPCPPPPPPPPPPPAPPVPPVGNR